MKRPKNLLLDADLLNRAESYCEMHKTNLSQLVSDFLRALPLPYERAGAKSPIVQRLRGAAISAPFTPDAYREFLYREQRKRHDDRD